MSTSYTAYAVIGVRVPFRALYRRAVYIHTEHPVPEGAKYCPECGKEARIVEDEPIWDEDFQIGGFPIYKTWDGQWAVFGIAVRDRDYYWEEEDKAGRFKKLSVAETEETLARLEIALGPLWDAETLGLHAVLVVS